MTRHPGTIAGELLRKPDPAVNVVTRVWDPRRSTAKITKARSRVHQAARSGPNAPTSIARAVDLEAAARRQAARDVVVEGVVGVTGVVGLAREGEPNPERRDRREGQGPREAGRLAAG